MARTTITTMATAAGREIGDVIAGRALRAFYFAVLSVALVGSAMGAEHWLNAPFLGALAAVALYELGGVALSIFADKRRQKGERALAARVISAGFAAGAVGVQLVGHRNAAGDVTTVGYFFAGLSTAGYLIYLLESAAKRRDALREAGKLAEPPPVYGAYQWIRHPWLTRRARALAVTNAEIRLIERITSREAGGEDQPTTPLLGRAGSLAAAAAQVNAERSQSAIRRALGNRIARGVDPTMATIAVNTYDLDQVAQGIRDGADYPALTSLLAAELTPTQIAAGITARRNRWTWLPWRRKTVETAPETVETVAETVETAPETDAMPAWPGAAPAGTRLQRVYCARYVAALTAAAAPERVAVLAPPAPRMPETVETALETVETEPEPVVQAPPLPKIEPFLLPHLVKVMHAHNDWDITIGLPSRHPEALTYAKIKAAIGSSGQQTAFDVRTALLSLRVAPEAAREYVEANAPMATA